LCKHIVWFIVMALSSCFSVSAVEFSKTHVAGASHGRRQEHV
jgi:hypothetical protein